MSDHTLEIVLILGVMFLADCIIGQLLLVDDRDDAIPSLFLMSFASMFFTLCIHLALTL